MNWIILIVAGFFESGFAFCLGKMKEVSGWGLYFSTNLHHSSDCSSSPH